MPVLRQQQQQLTFNQSWKDAKVLLSSSRIGWNFQQFPDNSTKWQTAAKISPPHYWMHSDTNLSLLLFFPAVQLHVHFTSKLYIF